MAFSFPDGSRKKTAETVEKTFEYKLIARYTDTQLKMHIQDNCKCTHISALALREEPQTCKMQAMNHKSSDESKTLFVPLLTRTSKYLNSFLWEHSLWFEAHSFQKVSLVFLWRLMIILSLLSLAVINVDSPRCQVLGESICLFIQD